VLEYLYHKAYLCQRDIAAKVLKSTGNITLVINNLEKLFGAVGARQRRSSVPDNLSDWSRDSPDYEVLYLFLK